MSPNADDAYRGEQRIEALEAKVDELTRRIAEVSASSGALLSRINATTMFFENRVDLIYRRVCVELRQYLGMSKVDTEFSIETDLVLNKALLAGFRNPIDAKQLELSRIVSSDIAPGRISSPLTLWGFRLNRRSAREMGNCIEIHPEGLGICIYGPYKRLVSGTYTLKGLFKIAEGSGLGRRAYVEMDVFSSSNDSVVANVQHYIRSGEEFAVNLDFSWPQIMSEGTVEFRIHQYSGATLQFFGFELEAK